MKRIIFCLLIAWSSLSEYGIIAYESVQDLLKAEHGLDGDQFSNYVYRRYYFVKRLQNTMLLFLDIENRITKNGYQAVQLDGLFDFTETTNFKDSRVQRSVDVMQQKRSLKPLFMIWEDFTGYKSIKDQIFVEEFTKEVFIISRNMLITLAAIDEFIIIPPYRAHATTEQLLDDIDFMTEEYRAYTLGLTHGLHNSREVDLHTFAHIDEVMMRFYLVKRLKIPCQRLTEFADQNIQILNPNTVRQWKHPQIVSCNHIMLHTKSLEPLIALWDDILQYKYVQDELFMYEFSQLVLCIFADLAITCAERNGTKDSLSAAIELYHLIDSLPLNEILDVIDIIAHDLPPLLEKYEFDSDITWKAWLRKYWWAPPLIAATLAVRILMTWEAKNILNMPPKHIEPPIVPPQTPSNGTGNEGEYAWMLDIDGFFAL